MFFAFSMRLYPDVNTNAFGYRLKLSGKKVTSPQVRGCPYDYDPRQPVSKIQAQQNQTYRA